MSPSFSVRAALACAAISLVAACAEMDRAGDGPAASSSTATSTSGSSTTTASADTYEQSEIVTEVSNFFGITAEAAGQAVERVFRDNGRPVGYIRGEEVAGAVGVGLRYGEGTLTMKRGPAKKVFWQGPSVGFDTGANASKVFTLVYGLNDSEKIYQRFPGVEGSAYLVGGVGVNLQRSGDVTLAPMRAGVGLRAGANIGYLNYTRERNILPL